LSNAIAHGNKDNPIYIRLYLRDNMQILDIAYHGHRITKEQCDALFQPFCREEGTRNDRVMGSGLRLSIVASFASMMCGKVEMFEVDYAEVCIRVQMPNRKANI
jgi:two-component system sensor histidine kinase GlrK